jgi:hypothetical protein
MKILFAICLLVAAVFASAAENAASVPPAGGVVKGEVLEVVDAGSFTYLRLKTRDGEFWSAVGKAAIKTGAEVTVENVMVMKDFKSKTLNRTFPVILLGNLAGTARSAPASGSDMAAAHAGMAGAPDTGNVKVDKAKGANARTVAEIVTKRIELKDKTVLVRGKVVKYNAEIMGKNWVHLRDGSGSAADNSNDVLVTTTNPAKVGDVVTATGVVHIDKDFGAGYAFKVLIEDATLQK